MAMIEVEKTNAELIRITGGLDFWYKHRESDSIQLHKVRWAEYDEASRRMKDLIHDVVPEQKVVLTLGALSMDGIILTRGAYDFYTERSVPIKSGESLAFDSSRILRSSEAGDMRSELYLKCGLIEVSLSGVAKVLAHESQLRIFPAEQAEEIARYY